MKRKLFLSVFCLTALVAVAMWMQAPSISVSADAPTVGTCPPIGPCEDFRGQRFTYCHIAGLEEDANANEIELTTSCEGLRGHFDIQGNPLAGHERDTCGPCSKPCEGKECDLE